MAQVSYTVNQRAVEIDVEDRTLLVDALRDELQLTGTHVGCDTSQCGCCTIRVNGAAVKSCTMLAVQAQGAEITTIEGVADGGKLHPVQTAFSACHGLQCGFCTPGMIMATIDLLTHNPHPSDEEIRKLIKEAQANILYTYQDSGLKLKLLHALHLGRHCIVNPWMVSNASNLSGLCDVGKNDQELLNLVESLKKEPFSKEKSAKRVEILNKDYNNDKNTAEALNFLKKLGFN